MIEDLGIRSQESEVRSRRDVACYVSTGVRSQKSGVNCEIISHYHRGSDEWGI